MATQSSAAVMFRGLVMLACLIAIPLVAVCGKSLPVVFQSLLEGRWPTSEAPPRATLEEAPRFEPPGQSMAAGVVSPWQDGPSRPSGTPPGGSMVVAASYQSSQVGEGPQARVIRAGGGVADNRFAPKSLRPGVSAVRSPDPAAKPPTRTDQFTHIQNRLRQLGSTYYLLESWGSGEQLYRFYCKVAVGGNPNYTHYFEATNADSLRAMGEVLRQVEAWRAGRQ